MNTPERLLSVLLAAVSLCGAVRASEHPVELEAHRKPALSTGGTCVIRNVVIHSAVGARQLGDVYVKDGKIAAVGKVSAPAGTFEIDGAGRHLAPGVIDCHSHTAISRGVNEGSYSITAECDISDALDCEDVNLFRAAAGGVTTARLLHGSANTIGGRHEIIKIRYGKSNEELVLQGAKEGVKFALGENVKRSNSGSGNNSRFPATRMGVETLFQRAFTRAREYQREWAEFEAARKRGEDPTPPRKDVRLDALVGILESQVDVHSHCYRADEIVMLLRIAEQYGFRVKTLQHVLEGYKVAHEIAKHGAGPSTFSDWWAYKVEAYDAVPFNATLLDRAGAVTSVNSDSDELMRHLYTDAAKSIRYGGLDPVRALALVTLNPAIQLDIDKRTGSIEVGKDADLVLHTHDPLSCYARVEWTMVDGEVVFQRRDAFELDSKPAPLMPIEEPRKEAGALPAVGGETVAIVGATLHPITGPDVENGVLVMSGGRIVALGAGVAIPPGARVVDAAGKHVWPGVIALNTRLGLHEIGSVQATRDEREIGGNQPDVRAAASLAADSAHIGVTRYNGVTRAQSAPQSGGPLRGQSCVIRLTGDTWEELLHVDRDMLHIAFPTTSNTAKEKKTPDAVKELSKLLAEAREYQRVLDASVNDKTLAPLYDPRLEALAPFALGRKRVAVRASNAQTILHAIKFVGDEKLDAVLFGVGEGWKVVEQLAASKLPVVVEGTLKLPSSDFDPYDAAYANPAVLHRAGVPLAISSGDDENIRNVVFHASMAAAFGLPREEALRSVTIYAARTLGLEQELGSLAPGKIADVVITDGDLLEHSTHVEYVFIDGRQQSLANRQTELYEKYRARLERMAK